MSHRIDVVISVGRFAKGTSVFVISLCGAGGKMHRLTVIVIAQGTVLFVTVFALSHFLTGSETADVSISIANTIYFDRTRTVVLISETNLVFAVVYNVSDVLDIVKVD